MRLGGRGRGFLAGMALLLAMGDVWAAQAPRGCLTDREHVAAREVRHGVRLREMSFRCDQAYPHERLVYPRWQAFSERFAAKFVQQVNMRRKAMAREYPGNADVLTQYWDDRLVVHFRYLPLTQPYCRGISDMLDALDSGGWNAFARQAAAAQNEIKIWRYRMCR